MRNKVLIAISFCALLVMAVFVSASTHAKPVTPESSTSASPIKYVVGVAALGAALTMALRMVGGVPTLVDAATKIVTASTITATGNSASYDNGTGFSPGSPGQVMAGVVDASALDLVTGDETYVMTLQQSDDNSTFTSCGPASSVTATGRFACWGLVTKRYVRIAFVLAGTTPSITYSAYIHTPARA